MKKKSILIILAIVMIGTLALLTLTACENEANIDNIRVYSAPKTSYYLGEEFDLNGAKILVTYVNGQEKLIDVTSSMISDFDSSVLGTQYIKIYYGNSSVTVMVEVKRRSVATVELEIPSENYDHVQGQNLKTEGNNLIITYVDSRVETVPVTAEMCSGYDRDTIGQQSITVTYNIDGEVVTSTYAVNVREREISRIEITVQPSRNIYYLGDTEIDLNGGELFVTYNNGYSERFQMVSGGTVLEGLKVVSFDSGSINSRVPVTLEYYGFTVSYNVSVQERNVASYEFLTPVPEQLQGTPFDWGDAVIRITYTNGEILTAELPDDRYVEVSGYVPSAAGQQSLLLQFKYGEAVLQKQDVLVVTVNARSLIGLEIVSHPDIFEDTAFDISEFVYRYVYDNGEYGDESKLTNSMIVWQGGVVTDTYDEPGQVTWLIRQSNIETEYTFEVKPLEVTDILFYTDDDGGAIAVIYRGTGEISYGDLEIEIVYNSGASERAAIENIAELDNGSFELRYDAAAALGYTTAEFVFRNDYEEEFTKEASVVIARAVSAVNVISDGGSFVSEQALGTAFDPTGLELEVVYTDGGSETFTEFDAVFYNAWSFVPVSDDLDYDTEFDGISLNLIFKEVGVYALRPENRGISESTVFGGTIAVSVTNAPVSVAGMYRDENGIEAIDPDDPSEFVIPTGASIKMDGVWLEIVYEGVADGVNLREFVRMTDPRVSIVYNGRDNLTPGIVDVPYSFTEDGVTLADPEAYAFAVTVQSRSLVDVESDVSAMKTEYVRGESLSFTGLKVNLVYDNGTRVAVSDINAALQSGTLSYSGYNASVSGVQTVTLVYTYYEIVDGNTFTYTLTDTFEVTVNEAVPVSVAWTSGTSAPQTELYGGAPLELNRVYVVSASGYSTRLMDQYVTVTYSDGSARVSVLSDIIDEITVDESSYNLSSPGTQSPRLVYRGCEFYILLTIAERTLSAISLNVSNITVVQEADINLSGITVNLEFSDGTHAQVPLEKQYIAYSADSNPNGYDAYDTLVGERNVTVYYVYEGVRLETTVTVSVVAKQLVKIEINGMPPKQYYVEGEEFEVSETDTVRIYYSNGLSDVVSLADATVIRGVAGEVAGQFNIRLNTSAPFDNSEIDGNLTRTQKIVIDYTFDGVTAETSYLVYMRDRRTPTITFNPSNVYERVYKDENADVGISLTMMGYFDYDTIGKSFTEGDGTDGTYKIYYTDASGKVYDTLPVDAGTYTVVVYYAGDAVHNEFTDTSRRLVIAKRPITVTFLISAFEYAGTTVSGKVYGQITPDVTVTASGFAEGEGFDELYKNPGQYSTFAFVTDDKGTRLVNIFDFGYFSGASPVEMNEKTAAGTYALSFVTQNVSENYAVTYQTQAYTVARRQVKIDTESVSATYGAIEPSIPIYASAIDGVAESGLVNNDTVLGALLREKYNSDYDVGEYLITAGTLNTMNPNYLIVFENSADSADAKWFTIKKRTVYVQVGSSSKIYGAEYVAPGLSYFGDAACTDSSSAFASMDSALTPEQILGAVIFVYPGIDESNGYLNESGVYVPYYRTPVGSYVVSATPDGKGERAENYDVRIVNGRLTVTARSLKVEALSTYKQYGFADPEPQYVVEALGASSGLIEGDELYGELSRSQGEAVGEYAITLNTLSNPNYNITFVSARFVITSRNLIVSIDESGLQKIYDGKTPSVSAEAITLFEADGETAFLGTETGIAGVETPLTVLNYLTLNFQSGSKNAGSYPISVASSGANYIFATDADYTYVISPYTVKPGEIDYFVTADGASVSLTEADLVYKAAAYQLSASIGNPMPVYNADGSQATDNMNRPRYDEVFVTLNISGVTDAGSYTVYATGFDTSNYALEEGGDYSVSFDVKSKEVVITLLNAGQDPDYPLTLVREYGSNSLLIYGVDYYTSVDEEYGGNLPFSFEVGVLSNGTPTVVTEVYFDSDGNPVVYDVGLTTAPANANFNVVFKEEYKFVMLPRAIVIRIFDNALSKVYDGAAPSVSGSQFNMVDVFAGFDTATVFFTFDRILSDGRSDSSVGEYTVSVGCTDLNFTVSAASPYIYTIKPATVTYTLNTAALTKYYDGADIKFELADINFGTAFSSQNAPAIRTYAYGNVYNGETGAWKFSENLTAIGDSLTSLRNAFGEINLERPSEAKSYITRTRNVLSQLRQILNSRSEFLDEVNFAAMLAAINDLDTALGAASNAIDASDTVAAQNYYASAQNLLNSLTSLYFEENSYIALIVGQEGVTEISEVTSGSGYPVTAVASDYNITFVMSNQNPTVRIQPRTFEIHVPSVSVEYGSGEQTIEYSVFDVVSGTYLVKIADGEYRYFNDNGTRLYIRGDATRAAGNNRGTYQIYISDIHIYADGESDELSPNYSLVAGTGANFGTYTITRANLTIAFGTIDVNLIYGSQISQNAIINKALDQFYVTDGHLAEGEELTSVVNFTDIAFVCLGNDGVTNLIGSTASVSGSRVLTATLPASASQNYNITIEPGALMIQKATLRLSYAISGAGNVEKYYGDTLTMDWFAQNLAYSGFVLNETADTVYGEVDGKRVSLATIVWNYTAVRFDESGETVPADDPLAATAPVSLTSGNDPVYVMFSNDKNYVFENYNLDFGDTAIAVVIVPKELSVRVLPSVGSVIETYYTGMPPESSYTFSYSGFVNGESADQFGIQKGGENQPSLNALKNNGVDYSVGTYSLGANNLNLSAAQSALENYTLSVQTFRVRVNPIPIVATLKEGMNVLYTYNGADRGYQLQPYTITYGYTTVSVSKNSSGDYVDDPNGTYRIYLIDRSSVSLSDGQYGVDDFRFDLGIDAETLAEYGITINDVQQYIDALKGGFGKYEYSDMPAKSTTPGAHTDGMEYYDLASLYVHNVIKGDPVKNADGTYTATCRLENMETGNSNYVFTYADFSVNVVTSVVSVVSSLKETLSETDIADYIINGTISDEFRQVIAFFAMNAMLANEAVYGEGDVADTAYSSVDDNIILELISSSEYKSDITYLLKVFYSKQASLGVSLGNVSYTYSTYTRSSDGVYTPNQSTISLSDERLLDYNSDEVYSMLPLRFRKTSTASSVNPAIGGLTYGIATSSSNSVSGYFTNGALGAYDAGYFEVRADYAASFKDSSLSFLLNGTATDGLYMTFYADSYNYFTLEYYSMGTVAQSVRYSVPYGRFFDGEIHRIRFEISKDGYTFIASVDGYSGALLDLGTFDAYKPGTEAGISQFNENSYGGLRFRASNVVLRRAEYYTVGRYSDKRGILVSLKANSSVVVAAAGESDYFTLDSVRLSDFFGLSYVMNSSGGVITYLEPDGYDYIFYLDGVQYDYEDLGGVVLTSGRHLVEVAIYTNGTLVDVDGLTLEVVSALDLSTAYVARYDSQGNPDSDNPEDYVFDETTVLELYDRDDSYTGENAEYVRKTSSEIYSAYIMRGSTGGGNYVSTAFTAERSAIKGANSQAYYPAYADGAEFMNIMLFSLTPDSFNLYDGIVLAFTITQAADQNIGSGGTYELTAALYYTIDGAISDNPIATLYSATLSEGDVPLFSLTAYVDRNFADYFGSGNMNVIFGADGEYTAVTIADETMSARIGMETQSSSEPVGGPLVVTTATYTRVTVYDVAFGAGLPAQASDYVSGSDFTFVAGGKSASIADGRRLYLSENGQVPGALRHNGVTMSFKSATDGKLRVYLSLNGVEPEAAGSEGVYLEFDFDAATLTFRFYMSLSTEDGGGVRLSAAQSVSLTELFGEVPSEIDLDARYSTDVNGSASSMKAVSNLSFGSKVILQASANSPVYYETVQVTLNGERIEFYCPLFSDNMGLWLIDNGDGPESFFGSSNPYGNAADLENVPSFIGYFGFVAAEYTGGSSVTVDSFGAYLGTDNSGMDSAITETPAI